MLQILQYEKWYGKNLILKIPSLEIPEGIHWFKGGNGSGKTTFFTSLAGLIPFKGEVNLDGLHLQKDAVTYRLQVNYGEAEPQYPEWVTGLDLIRFIGEAKRAEKKQIEELIEIFKMQAFQGKAVGTYSSGMLKKLSLLLAFLGKPKIIMLDEPLITLDQDAISSMEDLIKQYSHKGVIFLLSSHQDFGQAALNIQSTYVIRDKQLYYGNSPAWQQKNPA